MGGWKPYGWEHGFALPDQALVFETLSLEALLATIGQNKLQEKRVLLPNPQEFMTRCISARGRDTSKNGTNVGL